MKVLRVYVDTSVIGGCFDSEFEPWSNGLVTDLRRGHFRPVLSDVTSAEIALAPAPVRELYAELLGLSPEVVQVGAETLTLLAHYEARGVLGKRFRNDMIMAHLPSVPRRKLDDVASSSYRLTSGNSFEQFAHRRIPTQGGMQRDKPFIESH